MSNIASEKGLPDGLGLLAIIREDWTNHERDWTRPGFRSLAVHRFGVWRMQTDNKLLRMLTGPLYRIAYRRCRNVYGIELPYAAYVGRSVVIEHQGGIVVHGNTVIGNGCILRQGVTLGIRSLERLGDAPHLISNVNIGAGACIIGKVTVGDGAAVGANSVVLHDVPAGVTVVGIPAKPVSAGNSDD